eukprot:1173367-Prorocentrum_minimum.AAC.1
MARYFHIIAATVTNPFPGNRKRQGLSIRVGIHSGPAYSGIVVRARCSYGYPPTERRRRSSTFGQVPVKDLSDYTAWRSGTRSISIGSARRAV